MTSLTNLDELRIHDNPIEDISPLSSLTNLTILWAVAFPDPNLAAAVRELIPGSTGPIYASDLEELTSLSVSERSVADLTGLGYCLNLRRLELYGNDITDISPLTALTELTLLYLNGNQITDISPLASLTNLTRLYLNGNQITDISPLAENSGLADGDSVDLRDNPLDETSIDVHILQLQQRGVEIDY